MTCCVEPLIALAGGASIISTFVGIVSGDPKMFIGGILALVGLVAGFYLYILKVKTKRSA